MKKSKYFSQEGGNKGKAGEFLGSVSEKYLEAMGEEELDRYPQKVDLYRFLWLSKFTHPSAVRVFRNNDGWGIVGKVTDGQGRYFPGRLAMNRERRLNASESRQLERLLHALQFWTMPVADDRQGLDGETWIIEGAHEDKYHAVHRWCPGQRPLLKIEKFLKAVSGISQYRPDPKVLKQRLEADQQVQAELNRQRSDAIRRSNAMARRLAVKRIIWGLTCPYCRKQSRLIRFMNKSPHAKSYFICPCGRSFRSEEYDSS